MTEVTHQQLLQATTEFFTHHWVIEKLGQHPSWQNWEPFLIGSEPNYQHPGCYAVFFGSDLRYIGSGTSRGNNRYVEHGISRRLRGHVYKVDSTRRPNGCKLLPKFAGATAIYTLGLPGVGYLAPALEAYLIRHLNPSMNKVGKRC